MTHRSFIVAFSLAIAISLSVPAKAQMVELIPNLTWPPKSESVEKGKTKAFCSAQHCKAAKAKTKDQ